MNYHLAEACQNTFVLFDCLNLTDLSEAFFLNALESLKKQGRDDALILFKGEVREEAFTAHLIVLGLDGEIAEFCGNGARACAAYLHKRYPFFKTMHLKTPKSTHRLNQWPEEIYSVTLPSASFEWNPKFITNRKLLSRDFQYVETGEPHLLIKKMMGDEQLLVLGRKLNQQTDLFPLGINVNAWSILEQGKIFVKTYERGVQRLTRSCGTGSVACAAFYQNKGSVEVVNPGGSLQVIFKENEVELYGSAKVTL